MASKKTQFPLINEEKTKIVKNGIEPEIVVFRKEN